MKTFKAVFRGGKDGNTSAGRIASSATTNLHDHVVERSPSSPDISATTFPEGIKELHPCDDAVVDACFVHGLTGNRDEDWTATSQQAHDPSSYYPDMKR